MKLDAALPVDGKHLRGITGVGSAAEELGFSGLWTSETKHDSFLPLAVAAGATERLSLGNSVAIAFSRSPMVTAQLWAGILLLPKPYDLVQLQSCIAQAAASPASA